MRNLRMHTRTLTGLTALTLVSGCDSQAGEGYTGEPLLTLHGNIVEQAQNTSDLVPVLGFQGNDKGHSFLYIVDGHVSGTYPAQFQFDVMDVPPAQTLAQLSLGTPIAEGQLLIVPRVHKSSYDLMSTTFNSEFTADANSAGSVTTGTQRTSTCNWRTNVCVNRTYACTVTQCEVIAASGDPALAVPENTVEMNQIGGSVAGFAEGKFASWKSYYDPNDINHFYREIRYCDTSGLLGEGDGLGPSEGTTKRCTLVEQTGDPSVDELKDITWYARDISILYVPEARPDFQRGTDLLPLARGYNLVEVLPTPRETVIAMANCWMETAKTAVDEYNASNGTSYTPNSNFSNDMLNVIEPRWVELENQCPNPYHYRKIDPAEQSLAIQLTNIPNPSP